MKVVYELVKGALKPIYCKGIDKADVSSLQLDEDSLPAECARSGRPFMRKIDEVNGLPFQAKGCTGWFMPTFDSDHMLSGVRVEFE